MIFRRRRVEYVIEEAREDDVHMIAELHAAGFRRGWSRAEIAGFMGQKGMSVTVARPVGKRNASIAGFNIFRQTEIEAEIISVAVAPAVRGHGVGGQLMRDAIRKLHADRVPALFLEVDENNGDAIRLYKRLGFDTVGMRPGYYRAGPDAVGQAGSAGGGGTLSSALVMRLELG